MNNDTEKYKVILETIKEIREEQVSQAKRSPWLSLMLAGMTMTLSGMIFGLTNGNFYFLIVGIFAFFIGRFKYLKVDKRSKGKERPV